MNKYESTYNKVFKVEPDLQIELMARRYLFVLEIAILAEGSEAQRQIPEYIMNDTNLRLLCSDERNNVYVYNGINGSFQNDSIHLQLSTEDFYEVYKYIYNLILYHQCDTPPNIYYYDDYNEIAKTYQQGRA